MAGSQARKQKERGDFSNADKDNAYILQAAIKNLELSLGANAEEDELIRATIASLKARLKNAKGGNHNTQKRPKETRPWR